MTWAQAQQKASIPGSAILNAWRANSGPETTGRIRNLTQGTQYTLGELAALYDYPQNTIINPRTAMQTSAVYSCVSIIAGSIASMPLPVYQRTKDGREKADHPYWWLFNEQPNQNMSAAVYWEYILGSMLLFGDGFSRLRRVSFASADIIYVEPLHPDTVDPFLDAGNRLLYRVSENDGSQTTLSSDDILHFPTIGFDGCRSLSRIQWAARNAVRITLNADAYTAESMANGARPDVVLMTDKNINEEQGEQIRKAWISRHSGPKW